MHSFVRRVCVHMRVHPCMYLTAHKQRTRRITNPKCAHLMLAKTPKSAPPSKKTIAEINTVLDRGSSKRRTAETLLNKTSSRSHRCEGGAAGARTKKEQTQACAARQLQQRGMALLCRAVRVEGPETAAAAAVPSLRAWTN